ncbi:hypothetical protein [Labilithrix luteola]|uniref:hypothetical protein n=1 Tax=Labilithrix luteola TaxID=1391654 RepID=UPI001F0A4E88|nr:hypothetical protein [Labilithrix luteola]
MGRSGNRRPVPPSSAIIVESSGAKFVSSETRRAFPLFVDFVALDAPVAARVIGSSDIVTFTLKCGTSIAEQSSTRTSAARVIV